MPGVDDIPREEKDYSYQFTLLSGLKLEPAWRYKDEKGNFYTIDEIEQQRIDIVSEKVKTPSGNIRTALSKIESDEYDILIMKDGKAVEIRAEKIYNYWIIPEVYRMDEKFKLTMNELDFDAPFPIDGFEKLTDADRLKYLIDKNNKEYELLIEIEKNKREKHNEKPEGEILKKELSYLTDVIVIFDNWYDEHASGSPAIKDKKTSIDDTIKKKNYTKVDKIKKADIEIAAALRTYPKPPTYAELENESMRVLTIGRISKTTWWHLHNDIKYWELVTEGIEGRLKSKRELKQDTIDRLVGLKDILTADLAKMKMRKEYEERKNSGDIYEEKNAREYVDNNMGYIKTKKDKSLNLGDNFDNQEATEFDD